MVTDVAKDLVVGIDVGGTGTKIGIVDAQGVILARDESLKTPEYKDFEGFVDAMNGVVQRLVAQAGVEGRIRAIGIGAPNANYYAGTIENAPNLPWKGVLELCKVFSQKAGVPVYATNDANAIRSGAIQYTDEMLGSLHNIVNHAIDSSVARYDNLILELRRTCEVIDANRASLNAPAELETEEEEQIDTEE